MIASITMSRSCRSPTVVAPRSRPRIASASSCVRRPFSTALATCPRTTSRPRSERGAVGVEQDDVVAGLGRDLGDAVPHESRANDADLRDVRHVSSPPRVAVQRAGLSRRAAANPT